MALPMATSFETHRFAMLLRMRSKTLVVRSAATPSVSNHEAPGCSSLLLRGPRIDRCGAANPQNILQHPGSGEKLRLAARRRHHL
jgi:hypothetical protein